MNMPIVSVIMATYNDEPAFLKTCVYSILDQTFKDFEFIIVVEPDETNTEFLQSVTFVDNRIKLLKNESRLGLAGSRNKAIEGSSGKYIALIDGDDYCDLNRFRQQVNFLDKNPDISIVGANMYFIDEHGNIVGERNYPEMHEEIKKYFLITMAIANPTVMVRRKDIDDVGLFNDNFKKAEDFELWMRFLKSRKKMHNIQERLVYYRLPLRGTSKRNKMHLKNIYTTRLEYSKFIWHFCQRFPSLFLWFLISQIPEALLDYLLKLRIVNHMKNIRKCASL
jgi:glycosyltransferase EpsE